MKKKRSIRMEVLLLAVVPVFVLGICLTVMNTVIIRSNMVDEVRDQLQGIAHTIEQTFSTDGNGDIKYKDGTLYSGSKQVLESSFVDAVKDRAGIDITVFWGRRRVITSVRNDAGVRAVGTVASDDVVEHVLKNGEPFFSEEVMVNEMPYFGYYMPIRNHEGNIIGMLFAGKPESEVKDVLYRSVRNSVVLSVLIILLTIAICFFAANRVICVLVKIKEYMQRVSKGDFEQEMDPHVLSRHDELRDMGVSAMKLRDKVKRQVFQDSLTGLFNRRGCTSILSEWREEGKEITLAMIDIDFFKQVNDTHGHLCGDFILQEISGKMEDFVGDDGIVCRYGGEEFLIAYTGEKSDFVSKMKRLATDIRRTTFRYEKTAIKITLTIGVASRGDKETLEEHIDLADQALYQGKSEGRDKVIIW